MPIYVVTEKRNIVFCNDATCQWTGHDDEFLTSLKCRYHSGVDLAPSEKVAAGLCPPPTAFHGQIEDGFVFTHPAPDQIEFRPATFYPLDNDGKRVDSILVVVHGPGMPSPDHGQPSTVQLNVQLHAAITQIQYESASQINLDLVVGHSGHSQRIRRQIDLACRSGANVLITGPHGSGRRQIAELIHFANGPQLAGPLIPIDGSLCDAELVQRTIKDLYRSAKQNSDEPLGRLLLLDLDRMPAGAQSELSGFLKLPDFYLPMIATSASPIPHSSMPNELWQHVATITLSILSLAERREDIALISQALVEEFNLQQDRMLAGLEEPAIDMLVEYPWPGELAELKATVAGACRSATGPLVLVGDLPKHFRLAVRSLKHDHGGDEEGINLDQVLANIELELIQRAVSHAKGNKSQAAKLLGISRARLLRRLSPEEVDSIENDESTA